MSAVLAKADDVVDSYAALRAIKYKDWELLHEHDSVGRPYLRWKWEARCAKHGTPCIVMGRRWWLSPEMTESELVQTALLAAITAEEHETRERFTYQGKRVFNPHVSVQSLLSVCETEDARDGY
jgi:hypothetical protein